MTDAEEWRDIPGYEGYYQASTLGRIRSVDRILTKPSPGGGEMSYPMRGRVLRQTRCGSGYLKVNLSRDGEKANAMVHTLVALTFIGSRPPGMEVCHGPGGMDDCSLANLRYDTHGENELDKRRHGGRSESCGRGHLLIDANLTHPRGSRSRRQCRACSCAVMWRSRRRKRGQFVSDQEFIERASSEYERIVA